MFILIYIYEYIFNILYMLLCYYVQILLKTQMKNSSFLVPTTYFKSLKFKRSLNVLYVFIHNIKPHRFEIILPSLAIFHSLTANVFLGIKKKNYSNPLFSVYIQMICCDGVQCSVVGTYRRNRLH